MKLEPGVQAPEFSLQGADGNTYNLAGFRAGAWYCTLS